MVRRVKRQKFQAWWDAKRARWRGRVGWLAHDLGFATSERKARIYRAVERGFLKDAGRGSGYRPWHATYLHRQYRLKRKGRK